MQVFYLVLSAIIIYCVSGFEGIASFKDANAELIEFYYKFPASEMLNGVIIVFHGCSHSIYDYGKKSSSCLQCKGLPVELNLMNNGAKNGYLMVALGASNQVHHCWTKKDYEPSLQAIEYIYNELLHDPIKKTKLYLLGISSGGYFISIIAKQILRNKYNLSAVCLQISSLMTNSVQRIPSPLFIYMEKDINLAENIIAAQEGLSLHNIDTAKYAVKSKQINEAFLQYYYIPHADLIVQSLLAADYIDKTTGLLLEDPRSSRWREVVTNAVPTIKTYDSLVADDSALSEIFNLAYAYHEITDEYADGMFQWFASH